MIAWGKHCFGIFTKIAECVSSIALTCHQHNHDKIIIKFGYGQ